MGGWLTEYGDFDWVVRPSWLNDTEKSEVHQNLLRNVFTKDKPILVSIENVAASETASKLSRLMIKSNALTMDKSTAKNVTEVRGEVWAISLGKNTRYEIRSALGAYLYTDDLRTCDIIRHRPIEFDDWLITWIQGTQNYHIFTRPCKDGPRRFLGYKGGDLVMIPGNELSQNPKAAQWTFTPILTGAADEVGGGQPPRNTTAMTGAPITPAPGAGAGTPPPSGLRPIPLTGGGNVQGFMDQNGWTLVLQYIHKGETNPDLKPLTNRLPVWKQATAEAGIDGSTDNAGWGHAAPQLLSKINFTQVRFHGFTSNHGRVIHFATNEPSVVQYFKTGTGAINLAELKKKITPMSGHTANLPASATNAFGDKGDYAMAEFPFYQHGQAHWNIRAHNRWEMDDGGVWTSKNTIHRIWVK